MIAVLKHELRTYFRSLTAYVFGAFLLLFIGIGSVLYNLQAAVSNFEFVLGFSCLVFVVIVPILTMRVIAEERKQKTDQLLYSLPITTLEGSDYTIAVDGEKDDERIWKYQEDEVAIDALQDALETLDAEYSSDFLSDDPTGKEEIRLTVHLDNENHPKVDIELYRHDGEDCLAVVDGETFALVPRSDVVDLIEAVNAIVLN